MNNMDYYNADFEAALLEASAEFYKRKAAAWIQVQAAATPMPSSSMSRLVGMLWQPTAQQSAAGLAEGWARAQGSLKVMTSREPLACRLLLHIP